MCGLVVMLGLAGRPADAAVLSRMARSIAHRGPDDSGLYLHQQVGFGFRRLAILDLSPAGHQPMCSEDGQLVIVFNGEIYNYIELREELRAAGHCFRSTSDTEVLLAAYRQWGPECLGRLNGMWAFVIHDRRRGVLFGARDRFGVKPLFVHRGKDYWLFASEVKAILASGCYVRETNWQVAADFLLHGKLDETPATFYAGIEQVPPGCAFEIRLDGTWRQWRYWSLPDSACGAMFQWASVCPGGSTPRRSFAPWRETAEFVTEDRRRLRSWPFAITMLRSMNAHSLPTRCRRPVRYYNGSR